MQAAQVANNDAPVVPRKVPVGQLVQLVDPAFTCYWPTTQLEHTAAEAIENCPAAHDAVTTESPVVPQ